jgi:hypothetical protein
VNDAWNVSPILGVRNVRRAAEHYRDVFGFDLDPVDGVFAPSPVEPDGVYAIVKRGPVWIHLQIRRNEPPERPVRPRLERDVYLYVGELDKLHADLERRGARIVEPPRVAPHGLREFVVEDLDGHRLAFGEMAR